MLPLSFAVIVAGLILGGIAFCAFAWGWWRGQFDHMSAQARIVLDERDLRLDRPWESPAQREEREAQYGPLLPPERGEWGGAV